MRKKRNIKILVHGWLSATLDLLFHACLLALSHSGRHGRGTELHVPDAVVIMVLLLYCGWLWCCFYCCPCAPGNRRNIDVEKKRNTEELQKKCRKQKKSWNGPASNRRRRCWGGNFWEAREVPTEHAQEIDLKKYLVCLCPLPHDNHAANYRTVVVPGRICQRGVWCDKLFCLDKRECLY